MKSYKLALLYGFLVWLIPFIVGFSIFPLKTSLPALFESIMPVVLTVCGVFFSNLYFRRVKANFLKEGVMLGVFWFAISVGVDLLMFMWGPMKMTFANYMMDIGLTYLIYPAITIGFGYLIRKK